MKTSHPARTRLAATGLALVAAAAAVTLSGCSSLSNSVRDAWSVTYEVTSTTEAGTATVQYVGAEKKGQDMTTIEAGTVSTPWTDDTIVYATQTASVTATPEDETTLSCRILLDSSREIAAVTGEPGRPVTCEVDTPEFGS